MNDAQYYSYFDTAINSYLLRSGLLDLRSGPLLQFCAESHCKFLSELTFPETIEAGLRVDHLGRTSVRNGLGLFRAGDAKPSAQGWVVQVFVDRHTRRPAPLTPEIRRFLEAIVRMDLPQPDPPV